MRVFKTSDGLSMFAVSLRWLSANVHWDAEERTIYYSQGWGQHLMMFKCSTLHNRYPMRQERSRGQDHGPGQADSMIQWQTHPNGHLWDMDAELEVLPWFLPCFARVLQVISVPGNYGLRWMHQTTKDTRIPHCVDDQVKWDLGHLREWAVARQ